MGRRGSSWCCPELLLLDVAVVLLDHAVFLFDRGVDRALGGEGLLQTAFSVRTLALFERLPPSAGPSYLSGLVIGEELRGRPRSGVEEVVVIGAEPLAERFERALRRLRHRVVRLGEEAAWRGLHAVHRRREA